MLAVQTAAAQEQKDRLHTVWEGVYTSAQAQRGKAAYMDKCAGCHKDDLSGYQDLLKGENFMRHWVQDSLESLYSTIKSTMPRGDPASLSDQTYLDILAFLLQANDFPTGAHELTRIQLPTVLVQGRSGTSELASGALIDVAGCLVRNSDGKWSLNFATEPKRTRDPNDSTGEQLKEWDAKPPGAHQFGLMDIGTYETETLNGHKVEAKGFLIKAPGADRINLTALQMTGSKCGP